MLDQMEGESGYARLLHHLIAEVEVDFDLIGRPIATDALRDQQVQSLEPEKRWLYDVLVEGVLPGDGNGAGVADTQTLFENFQRFMRDAGGGRRSSKEALGRLLRQFGVEKVRHRVGAEGSRVYTYFFPPLPTIRSAFSKGLSTGPEWDLEEPWQPARFTSPLALEFSTIAQQGVEP
jgi:hypothetical protein